MDIVRGEDGNDSVAGDDGSDFVVGGRGTDTLGGGPGDDEIESRDGQAETVACGTGDDLAIATAIDTLGSCEVAVRNPLRIQTRPEISGNTATFRMACQKLNGCTGGPVRIESLDGQEYGSGAYANLPDDPQTFRAVQVELNGAGVAALNRGEAVRVTFGSNGGGYVAVIS
jgi:Ca2+-binding RTX toxin-like protein